MAEAAAETSLELSSRSKPLHCNKHITCLVLDSGEGEKEMGWVRAPEHTL